MRTAAFWRQRWTRWSWKILLFSGPGSEKGNQLTTKRAQNTWLNSSWIDRQLKRKRVKKMNAADSNLFNPTERMLRQFAAMWILFLGAIAARQEFHHHRHVAAIILAVLAVTVGPLGVAWPRAIKPVFVGWMALAYPVDVACDRVFRIMGKYSACRMQPAATSYWRAKPAASDQSQYLRQF